MIYTFGPLIERKRIWLLIFEDADMTNMWFKDENEAIVTFNKVSMNWNCTLFATFEDTK